MDEKDKIRLLHIIDAGERLSRFIKGKQKDDLKDDDMLLLASLKCIEIIGEAADKISNEFKIQNDFIPWKILKSMRNRLIHGYFDVNHEIIWNTITKDIPSLMTSIKSLLQ